MRLRDITLQIKRQLDSWWVISLIGAAFILLPILVVFSSIFEPPNNNWYQIKQYLVKDYLVQTALLIVLTAILTIFLGVTLAWIVAIYDFPGKRFFRWALVMPLAVPPYIAAYTYSTMFSYTGIVQKTLRDLWGIVPDQQLITLSSMRGAVMIFTLFLYPYVYLITRSFFEKQSASYIENARLLGRKPFDIFFRIALPISRPAIVGGVFLVIFEVLNDYGVTSYFGLQTISTAVFQTWFGMYDVDSAMRLAAWLMMIVVGLFLFESLLRKHRAYSSTTSKEKPLAPKQLTRFSGLGVFLICLLVWLLSFAIPLGQLIVWATQTFESIWKDEFLLLLYRTVYVAGLSTLLIILFSLIVATVSRSHSVFSSLLAKGVTAGYSIPGAIIAIGVLAICIQLDEGLAPLYRQLGMTEAPLVLSMSLFMLISGYFIRYMATGYHAIEVGFEKVGTKYTEAARMLGMSRIKAFFKVDLSLIKGAVISGFILTFVEICKDLPLALLLRPFNFETLATKTYQYANNEQIYEASIPSLLIIAISIISIYVLHYLERKWES